MNHPTILVARISQNQFLHNRNARLHIDKK